MKTGISVLGLSGPVIESRLLAGGVSLAKMRCFFCERTHVSLRSCRLNTEITHTNEIVSGCGEGEHAADPRQPPETGLAL